MRRFNPYYIKDMYNNWARRYDGEFKNNDWRGPVHTVRTVKSIFNLDAEGLELLDVGIGTGLVSSEFKEDNPEHEITGVDISKKMLAYAERKEVASKLIRHDFQAAGLPFEDESFDVAVSCGVFELLDEPENVIGEMGRVLRPSGAFALTVYSDSPYDYSCLRHDDELIENALREAGLGDYNKERFFAFNHNGNDIYYYMYSGLKQPKVA